MSVCLSSLIFFFNLSPLRGLRVFLPVGLSPWTVYLLPPHVLSLQGLFHFLCGRQRSSFVSPRIYMPVSFKGSFVSL